jgi:hypothetical protein
MSGRGSPEILYRHGDPDAAYPRLLDLTTANWSRLEYLGVSHSGIGTMLHDTMGITLEATLRLLAAVEYHQTP